MFWEDSDNESDRKKKGSFWAVSLLWRMEIVLAWVFMNFLLAWVTLTVLFTIWTTPIMISKADFVKQVALWNVVTEEVEWVRVVWVLSDSIWATAGFEVWDSILKIDWVDVGSVKEAIEMQKPSESFTYSVKKENWKVVDLPVSFGESWKLWMQITDKPVVKEIKEIKFWIFESAGFAFKECFRLSVSTVQMFWEVLTNLVTKWTTPDWVAWPIWIAQMTSGFVENWDFNWLLKFMALISLSLAVVNVLPIPALDWGRFVFLLIEWIIRRPLPSTWEVYVNFWGYIFLMWLLVLVSVKDVLRIFS